MNSRESTMVWILLGACVLGGGGVLGYMLVYSPLQDKWDEAKKLENENSDLDSKITMITAARAKIAEMRRQSLPQDLNQAKTEYKLLLERLLQAAKISDYKLPDARVLDTRAPITPVLAIPNPTPADPMGTVKKPAYTRLEFRIDIRGATIWQLVDFLSAYYKLDLLHQITELNITRDNKATDIRSGLEIHITCEAVILDQTDMRPASEQEKSRLRADPRPALFPVSTAVGAVGGNLAVQAVARKVEVARGLTPTAADSLLSAKKRDYSFLALRDMFYGLLPPEKPQPPFSLGSIDNVTINKPEEASTVKFKVSGEGSAHAKFTATASGSLLTEGPLTVDEKTHTISIPKVSAELGSSATSTISVTATSSEGKVEKRSFTVAMGKPPFKMKDPGPDIASAIKLTMVTGDSDGSVKAVIFDAANPYQYKLTGTSKSVEIVRWHPWVPKKGELKRDWETDKTYTHPPGVLAFADDFSRTKRTFKVLAIEPDAVIVEDITPPELRRGQWKGGGRPGGFGPGGFGPGGGGPGGFGPPGGGGPGGFGPGGFVPPAAPPPQKPAEPLSALVGNAPLSLPDPELYRWPLGKSLKEVLAPPDPTTHESHRLSADEAKKILKRIASEGPVGQMTVSSNP
jgi:hypothetical protein